jgi:phospho-N-acetylmuramoyl-pentapeptide-transferase
MLYLLGNYLQQFYGPFRLLTSHLFLAGFGILACGSLSLWLLPRFARHLPSDRGREFAVRSEDALGKPTGAGVLFVSSYVFIQLLVVPFELKYLLVLICIVLAMVCGYLDDRSSKAWSEYRKGFCDLLVSGAASVILWFFRFRETPIWIPFTKSEFLVGAVPFILCSTALLWIIINTINCTDGIDGLSGALSIIAFLSIGVVLYFLVGHAIVAEYLLLPHYADGARWAIMAFSMIGSLAGYLWHNAYPSSLLMGDAGSRALGLLIGILIINSGNPFILLTIITVVLINGGTGLVKVGLLRFFKIGILRNIRFPLHDHFRETHGWSNTQVLVRFVLIQAVATLILLVLFIKIR